MLETLTGAVGAILSGGATGLLGAAASRILDFKTEKMRLEHDLKVKQEDRELLRLEYDLKLRITDREVEGQIAVASQQAMAEMAKADATALVASHSSDKRAWSDRANSWVFLLVDGARGLIRPAATVYYAAVMTYVAYVLGELMQNINLEADLIVGLYKEVILMLLYLGAATTLWWFGARPKAPK